MPKEETFNIEYNGSTYSIPISNLKFQHGYAVVTYGVTCSTCSNRNWRDQNYTLMGVVDKNYETVLNFERYYNDINIFPGENLIATTHTLGEKGNRVCEKYTNYHYKIYNGKAVYYNKLTSQNFEIVNDKIIKLKCDSSESLYSVEEGKEISERFFSIGDYKKYRKDLNERFAEAKYRLELPQLNKKTLLACLIDEKGKIRSPLYNTTTKRYIDTSSPEFNFRVALISIIDEITNNTDKESSISSILSDGIKPIKK